ncbi:DUF397 domain-containing protein [Yinghuangia sp. YIM S09857]|uniref:DUF397 domain-containing protein n=1 Tax=Yinghuangia sp. YIM S09857 TaxID=3436929 RepID=UPI003F52CCCF
MAEIISTKPAWYRSSYSAQQGNCVEARSDASVWVRDSRRPFRAPLSFPAGAWSDFVARMHTDRPAGRPADGPTG